MSRRSRFAVLLVFVTALPLVSCGEDETAAYRESFAPLNSDIGLTGQRFDEAVRAAARMKNDAEVAVAFARLSSDAGHTAGSLSDLKPPENLSADHRRLIGGLRAASGKLSAISLAAVDGDARAAKRATADAMRVSSKIREPRSRIAERLGLG